MSRFLSRSILPLALALLSSTCSISPPRISVSLPFPPITRFHPAAWEPQQMLAQGTLFEGLFGYAPDPSAFGGLRVIPLLAESWRTSPDGRVWTFRIRKGSRWSNGDPVTAHDFEWAWKFLCSPANAEVPLWASALGNLSNASKVRSGVLPPDHLGVKALNDHVLRLVLESADYDLPLGLAPAGMIPLHRRSIESHPDSWWTAEALVCNGPYVVAEFTQGRVCVLRLNPSYTGPIPRVSEIRLRFDRDGIPPFLAGELDAAWIPNSLVSPHVLIPPKADAVLRNTVWDMAFTGYELTRSHSPLFDDHRVRRAFAISIDRGALARTVFLDTVEPAHAIWPRTTLIGRRLKPIPYDPEKARRLLAEAGYPEGRGFPPLVWFTPPEGDPAAEFAAAEWRKNLGVSVRVVRLDERQFERILWKDSPDTPPGFATFTGSMNYLNPVSLVKALEHTVLFYDYPAEVRRNLWFSDSVLRARLRQSPKGRLEADWDELAKLRDETARRAEDLRRQFRKVYGHALPSPESVRSVFAGFRQEWDKAQTAEERRAIWRRAAEALLDEEREVYAYETRSERHHRLFRAFHDLRRMGWDRALLSAHKSLQLFQDECYIVPLYHRRLRFVHRRRLRGLMVYPFAGGPEFFNFRHLRVR